MERRNFLKYTLAASAAITVGGWDSYLQAAGSSVAASKFKKSMMWGCIGVEGSVLEKCKAVKAAGFQGIEPNSHMNRQEVLDALKSTGLQASSVCNDRHWKLHMSSPDKAIREQGMEAMIVALEDAKAYGTDAVLLVPGIVSDAVAYNECWERSTECIKKIVPTAEKLGVKICIENVWNNFLLSPMEAARYVDQFNSKFVRFYFDIGNINIYGWPDQWIKILGNRLGRVHIKEFSKALADKEGRGKGFSPALGEGDINWPKVMEAIKSVNYGPWLTVEHSGGESLEGLKKISAFVDKISAY